MAGGVFVLKDQKTLVAMQPASFATEDDFQRLLADFPSLLSGDQIDGTSPRRWLLISREKSIPAEEGGGGRWALDRLFIDQDGVQTLVEVKRQTNTELRRAVTGQMMDYAANAVVYWPIEELRNTFEQRCQAANLDAEEEIKNRLGIDGDVEAFWQSVKINLQVGRIRMLFVADLIPPELRLVVEFLNEQMDRAEVLALELRQYEGEGLKTLVPIVYGQTQEARDKKAPGRAERQWDKQSILDELERRFGSQAAAVAQKIVDWMEKNADRVWFGRGARSGSMGTTFIHEGRQYYPLNLWTYGKVEIVFEQMRKPPFDDQAKRRELLRRLNEIDGVRLPADALSERPSIPLQVLSDDARRTKLLQVMEWFVAEVRKA